MVESYPRVMTASRRQPSPLVITSELLPGPVEQPLYEELLFLYVDVAVGAPIHDHVQILIHLESRLIF